MSYKTSFLDGESYGAADLNEITARLVTSGIADNFEDGVPYNVKHLNNLINGIIGAGVAPANDTTLRVIYRDGNYFIQPGLAFFGNGSTFEVLTDEIIEKNEYETTYIYLKSDEINNKNIIVVSELEPDASDNDIVYLAEISADGIITDHRTYAVGKFIGYQNEYNCLKKQEITHSITAYNNIKVEQELQTKDIKFLILVSAYSVGIISFDEDYTRCTYRRNGSYSGNITNDTAGIYAGVTTIGGNQLKVQISKKEGTENVYNFLYKIYSGSSRSDNNYGTIGYTIYYV